MINSKVLSLLISQSIFLLLLPWSLPFLAYLHPIALGVIWLCLTGIVFFMVFGLRGERLTISYPFFLSLFILYNITLLILLFFRPHDQHYETWNLIPFATISSYFLGAKNWMIATYNLLANIALFIPWGWFIRLHWQKWTFTLWISFTCILLIEILQFLTNRGSLDIDDFILNLLGVWIGYWLQPLMTKVFLIQK